MIWFPPKTWAAAEVPTAAKFNTYVRDAQLALITKCRAVKTATGGFGPSATEPCAFDTIAEDPTSMWSAALPTRITIAVPGRYRITGRLGGASSTNTQFGVMKNGEAVLNGFVGLSALSAGPWTLLLAAGDYLELFVITGTGVYTLTTTSLAVAGLSADLSVSWVAP